MNDVCQKLKPYPLTSHPQTLTKLGVVGVNVIVGIGYQSTTFEKTGKNALLTKLPIFKNLTPFKSNTYQMDIDLSCVVLDKAGQVLETIWYGNLRSQDQSIRHSGDALMGADGFEQSLVNQEEIHIRLTQLAPSVHHLLFFINSYQQNSLCQAQKGVSKLTDNEEHLAHKVALHTLDEDVCAVLAWHLQRQENDLLLAAPFTKVEINQTDPEHFVQNLNALAQHYYQQHCNRGIVHC